MKKFIYILGIVLLNILMLGLVFKMNHWPGASIMLTISIVLMVFVFFPSAIINSYKKQAKKNYYSLHLVSYITIAIILLGALFKIQHWPGAGILILIGLPLPFILFFPLYLRYHKKTKQEYNLDFFGMVFFLIFLAVFSAFLALSVSKHVLDSFAVITNNSSAIKNVLKNQNKAHYNMLPDTIPYQVSKEELAHYQKLTNNLDRTINQVKMRMAKAVNNQNEKFFASSEINYLKIYNKESKGGNYYLVVDPEYQEKKANELFKQYENFIEETQSILDALGANKKFAEITCLPEEFSPEAFMNQKKTGNNLIANLSILSLWQQDIRICEREILERIQN